MTSPNEIAKPTLLAGDQQQRLRELRLWHWRECMRYRALEKAYDSDSSLSHAYVKQRIADCHRIANHHLWAVQTLNDLFPVDDTAERDNAPTL